MSIINSNSNEVHRLFMKFVDESKKGSSKQDDKADKYFIRLMDLIKNKYIDFIDQCIDDPNDAEKVFEECQEELIKKIDTYDDSKKIEFDSWFTNKIVNVKIKSFQTHSYFIKYLYERQRVPSKHSPQADKYFNIIFYLIKNKYINIINKDVYNRKNAENVFEECLLDLLNKIYTFDASRKTKFETWFTKSIVEYKILSFNRDYMREKEKKTDNLSDISSLEDDQNQDEIFVDSSSDILSNISDKELLTLTMKKINNTDYQDVLILHHIGFTLKGIAEIVKANSESTIRIQNTRAKEVFQEIYNDLNEVELSY